MLTLVLYPPQFDPARKYPAIEICLGGPQGTLSQSWSYRWNYRLMAAQGYVVILPNRRGTTAFGQEWCEQISLSSSSTAAAISVSRMTRAWQPSTAPR